MKINKKFTCDFTQIPNQIINRSDVTCAAKGLYLYMVSKPEVWDFTLSGIGSQLKETRPTILRLLAELEQFGYIKKNKRRVNGKQAPNEYDIFAESNLLTQQNRLRKADSEIFTTSNTKKSNTKKSKKERGERARELTPTLQEPRAYLLENFLDVKSFLLKNSRRLLDNKHICFSFKGRLISISDNKVPYFRDGLQENLSFTESDDFYKFCFTNQAMVLSAIANQTVFEA